MRHSQLLPRQDDTHLPAPCLSLAPEKPAARHWAHAVRWKGHREPPGQPRISMCALAIPHVCSLTGLTDALCEQHHVRRLFIHSCNHTIGCAAPSPCVTAPPPALRPPPVQRTHQLHHHTAASSKMLEWQVVTQGSPHHDCHACKCTIRQETLAVGAQLPRLTHPQLPCNLAPLLHKGPAHLRACQVHNSQQHHI